ncbi:MAG: hypothetical protein IJC30_01825 [Alphaproteobacteria bacterium]|nr:hypothetical protein [Alphaproteobacteria bacterium]
MSVMKFIKKIKPNFFSSYRMVVKKQGYQRFNPEKSAEGLRGIIQIVTGNKFALKKLFFAGLRYGTDRASNLRQ